MTLAEAERDAILDALVAARGNKAAAARILDCSKRSVFNKMKRHGIPLDFGRKQNVPDGKGTATVRPEYRPRMPVVWRGLGKDRQGA